ncbi:uncharacterized protein [Chiloscyllium punctatum]|uniref:uncharacterized protein isoform X3 n=1 Tax=Chiloscyllium punctatum TaxID=137246 RepID=UPI003B63C46D
MKPRSKFENFPPPDLSTVRFRASFCQNSDRSMFCHSRTRAGESSPMEHLQSSSPNSVIKNWHRMRNTGNSTPDPFMASWSFLPSIKR